MATKEAAVFVVDMGKSMAEKKNGRDVSDFEWSMTYFWDRVTNIVWSF
jgi:ATP-dependent DNA helicase 2 subunit 2